jgi:hypothetical protein
MPNVESYASAVEATSRLLRMEQAADILNRSLRTVRYHARKRSWRKSRGL